MTKLEELARKLIEWGPAHWGDGKVKFFESELSIALEPLLEAAEQMADAPVHGVQPKLTEARCVLREQLTQWRKK